VTTTVWGIVGGENTTARTQTHIGQLVSAHSYRELDLELPPDGIRIDLEHRGAPYVGELVHAELGTDRKLRCVAVLDVDYTEADGQLYFSGSYATEEPARAGRDPRSGATDRAVSHRRAGEPRRAAAPVEKRRRPPLTHRFKWPISWRTDQLLARAAAAHSGWRPRTVTHIVDLKTAQLAVDSRRAPT
jgi:hypothetical protein